MYYFSYLNKITPRKPETSNAQTQNDLDRLVEEACDLNGSEKPIPPKLRSRRSVRSRLFGSHEPVPKRIKIVGGEKCPLTKCQIYIKHRKNLKRHLKQSHGERQPDGTFGLVRYVCQQHECTIETLNAYNAVLHQTEQHNKKPMKYERIVYAIDENVKNELEPYFN